MIGRLCWGGPERQSKASWARPRTVEHVGEAAASGRSMISGVIGAGVLLVMAAIPAAAEPMFLSKQYTRCSACHVSPTGGGLLSTYGRALSGSELSMSGRRLPGGTEERVQGEEAFLWGAFGDVLGPVQLGIELRPSRLRTTVGDFTMTRNIVMNADLIAAVQLGGWTAYGQIGRQPTSPGSRIDSYEHWVGYETARGFGVRAGRFLPAYGARFADHTSFNRSQLGFEKYDQVYGVEISRSTSRSLLQVTVAPGRAEALTDAAQDASFNTSGRLQVDLGPSTALVASGLYRNASNLEPRQGAAGVAFGFGPVPRVTVWSQADAQFAAGNGQTAYVFVNETSVEAVRGLWFKISPQLRTEAGVRPHVLRWAFSATLLPRTHWNLNTTHYREKATAGPTLKIWMVQLHMYL